MFCNKSSAATGQATLEVAESPVSEALILVCEKCGKKMATDPEQNPSREITQAMKAKIRETMGRGKVRGIVSGCLDICPKDAIAIAISRTGSLAAGSGPGSHSGGDEFYTLSGDLSAAADAILKQVMR